MDKVEAKLQKMGHPLPKPFAYPSPNRTGCILTGNLLHTSQPTVIDTKDIHFRNHNRRLMSVPLYNSYLTSPNG